jgi:hypothetical protein
MPRWPWGAMADLLLTLDQLRQQNEKHDHE